jgi:hypothetical protein
MVFCLPSLSPKELAYISLTAGLLVSVRNLFPPVTTASRKAKRLPVSNSNSASCGTWDWPLLPFPYLENE